MSVPDTKQALMDAAEALFAEHGFAATSMRDIAARARANLAAVNYHFGSKRGLMQAVLERRVNPLNHQRLGLLDSLERSAGRGKASLEQVLEALVGPALHMADCVPGGSPAFACLMGRTFIEPDPELHTFFMSLFDEVASRFIPAIKRAAPALPAPDLFWRLHFLIACLSQTMSDKERLREISKGTVDPDHTEAAIRQLVAFVAGGMRAPSVTRKKRRTR